MPLNQHAIDSFCEDIFEINSGIRLVSPQIPSYIEKKKEKKKIVLMPYACYAENYPVFLWNKIVCLLKGKGYEIYTNTRDSTEKELKGTRRLELNLIDIVKYCQENVAYVISNRSGICDLLCYANVKLIVLYNDKILYTWYGLIRLGGKAELNEIITEGKNESEVVDIIQNIIFFKDDIEI